MAGLTSVITDGCNEERRQRDNSHLSPDKYEVLDGHFPSGEAMVSGAIGAHLIYGVVSYAAGRSFLANAPDR